MILLSTVTNEGLLSKSSISVIPLKMSRKISQLFMSYWLNFTAIMSIKVLFVFILRVRRLLNSFKFIHVENFKFL